MDIDSDPAHALVAPGGVTIPNARARYLVDPVAGEASMLPAPGDGVMNPLHKLPRMADLAWSEYLPGGVGLRSDRADAGEVARGHPLGTSRPTRKLSQQRLMSGVRTCQSALSTAGKLGVPGLYCQSRLDAARSDWQAAVAGPSRFIPFSNDAAGSLRGKAPGSAIPAAIPAGDWAASLLGDMRAATEGCDELPDTVRVMKPPTQAEMIQASRAGEAPATYSDLTQVRAGGGPGPHSKPASTSRRKAREALAKLRSRVAPMDAKTFVAVEFTNPGSDQPKVSLAVLQEKAVGLRWCTGAAESLKPTSAKVSWCGPVNDAADVPHTPSTKFTARVSSAMHQRVRTDSIFPFPLKLTGSGNNRVLSTAGVLSSKELFRLCLVECRGDEAGTQY